MHWLSRSPAKSQSMAEAAWPALSSARARACFCMALSDFSQVASPKVSSEPERLKELARGPSPSFLPTTLACPARGGRVGKGHR